MRTELSQAADRLKITISLLGEYDYILSDLLDAAHTLLNDLSTADPNMPVSEFMRCADSVSDLNAALEQVKSFRYYDPEASGQLSLFDQ